MGPVHFSGMFLGKNEPTPFTPKSACPGFCLFQLGGCLGFLGLGTGNGFMPMYFAWIS
jgi:hypothetical protein